MAKPKVTILIVDDEEEICELLMEEFEDDGYQVLSATGGIEAFKLFKKHHVDVVLSDAQMPKGDGTELYEAIKNCDKPMPIFFLITGHDDILSEDGFEADDVGVISKPFESEELLNTVALAVSQRRTHLS